MNAGNSLCWVESGVLPAAVLTSLVETCPSVPRAGLREPFVGWPEGVASVEPVRAIASRVLGSDVVLTRAILFDKPPGRNWHLDVHQDLTVAVTERRDDAMGFGPWSQKDGGWHCEAPVELLRRMITIRVHLDDADEANGCLLAAQLPQPREPWKLTHEELQQTAESLLPMLAKAGDAVIMSPLTPHASGRNMTERHRRVLHMEFAAEQPGQGLRWRDEAEILGRAGPTRP